MKKLILITFILISNICFGQSPKDSIKNPYNVDIVFLEKVVFQEINNYRKSMNIPPMEYDSVLFKNSRNHSKSMCDKNIFQHSKSSVSENILCTPIFQGRTYEEKAKDIVKIWINSPPHNENMLSKSHHKGGVGINLCLYDKKKNYYCFYVTLQMN